MADRLHGVRDNLRTLLRNYSHNEVGQESIEQQLKHEAAYAATGLKADDVAERIKAVEFLEILTTNPFAQEHLLEALNDKEPTVVQKTLHALHKIAKPVIIPKLKEYMDRQKSKHIVAEVSRIISKLEKMSVD